MFNLGERAIREVERLYSFYVESFELKFVFLGIMRSKENCWILKGLFFIIMRILSDGFKFFEKFFRNVCVNDGRDVIKLENIFLF